MNNDRSDETATLKSVCTVAIFHTEEQKRALYEILGRMSCQICEITSLADLLTFVEQSDLTYLQFAEDPNEQAPRQYVLQRPDLRRNTPGDSALKSSPAPIGFSRKTDLMTLHEVEEIHIRNTLRRCGWMYKLAAKELGIDRTTLYRKMKRYGIEKDDLTEPV